LAAAIDLTAFLSVPPKHGGSLVAEHVPLDGDAALVERAHPLRAPRSLVEADHFGVLAADAADGVPYTGPGIRTEAHGARLGAGDQLVRGLPLPPPKSKSPRICWAITSATISAWAKE
jgi:hypothetical protein